MTLAGTYSCQNDGLGTLYTNAVAADFYSYVSSLEADGYSEYFSSQADGNLFAGYQKDGTSMYVYYMKKAGELRTIQEVYTAIPSYDTSENALYEPTVINFGFDFSKCKTPEGGTVLSKTGCGQSQIIILEDGSYVIIDGGAKITPADDCEYTAEELALMVTDRLYALLVENNQREDGKIVIASWIFTHLHDDHCTTFERFSKKYGANENIHVKYIMYNYPWTGQMLTQTSGEYTSQDPDDIMEYIVDTYYTAKPTIFIPRTGQKITLGGWEMEILNTVDNTYPETLTRGNNASMVFRLNPQDGKTDRLSVLFLGDVESEASEQLVNYYGDYLSTPIVQAAHHGYQDGGSEALYNAISAEYVIWSNSYARWSFSGSTGIVPNWIVNATDSEVTAYPQCNENEMATDWYLTFDNGKVVARSDVQS